MGEVDLSGHVRISEIGAVKDIAPVEISAIREIDPLRFDDRSEYRLRIRDVGSVAPLAAHIKEVNHIDPLSIDALNVTEVRGIEPIRVDKFHVTNLPTVNMAVRQLPAVDMNIRQLPPVSVGTHQNFDIPSDYTVRARFLGIEFFRVHLCGRTTVVPRERYRREQERSDNRSFPLTATAGNPAIPSECRETSATVHQPVGPCRPRPGHHPGEGGHLVAGSLSHVGHATPEAGLMYHASNPTASGALHVGPPATHIHVSGAQPTVTPDGGSVRSGG